MIVKEKWDKTKHMVIVCDRVITTFILPAGRGRASERSSEGALREVKKTLDETAAVADKGELSPAVMKKQARNYLLLIENNYAL